MKKLVEKNLYKDFCLTNIVYFLYNTALNPVLSLVMLLLVLPNCNSYANFPKAWQLGFQEAATHNMSLITNLHNFVMIILTGVVIIILGILVYICIRFNAKSHPRPMTFSHNNKLEVIWTLIPAVILVIIAVPSFKVLYSIEEIPKADMTVKVVGYQWYWHYQYPDHDNLEFDSNIVDSADLKPGEIRLLTVDNKLVIPENTVVRFIVTAGDVIHSFAVPAFGTKIDAVPGRINETWIQVKKRGTYYGQCSELCGINHGFMPIEIQVVSKDDFAYWIRQAKQKF